MTDPLGDAGAMAQAQAKAMVENAPALGLTWTRRPATVTSDDPIMATFDGDSVPIGMTSMIGPVYVGQRVYVDIIPPSGNYIVGTAVPTQLGVRARVATPQAVANAVQTTLSYDTIDEEAGGNFGAVPMTTVTIPASGLWAITVRTSLFAAGGARNFLNIGSIVSGITNVATSYRASFNPGETVGTVSVTIPFLTAGTFNTSIYQEGGANTVSAWLSVFRVGGYAP